MIRITVEMLPGGFEKRKRVMGVAEISLQETHSVTSTYSHGNYKVKMWAGNKSRLFRQGEVWDFPRKRLSVWHLLRWALNNIFGDKHVER